MRFARSVSLGLVIVLLAGCGTSVRTFSEADRAADFSSIRTYTWRGDKDAIQPLGGPSASPGVTALTLQAIRDVVSADLAARGLRREGEPDVIVDVRAGTRERLQTTFWARDPYLDRRRFGPYPGWPLPDRRTVTTVQETLVAIDIFDADTGKAIWSGIGATPADLTADDPRTIADVVAEVLKDFPPAPAS